MNYIRFKEHLFENDWPRVLGEAFPIGHVCYETVYETWYLDKPVSRISIYPDWDKKVNALQHCFYTHYESYDEQKGSAIGRIYFSRYPELVDMAREMDTDAIGVLFGYNNRDVASFVEQSGDTMSSPGHQNS